MAIFSGIATAIGGVFTSIAGASFAQSVVGGFLIRTAAKISTSLLVAFILRDDNDDQRRQPAFALKGSLQAGGAVPRGFPLGTSFTAGSLAYANTHSDVGSTPNAYWTVVIALSDLPVKGLAGMMVNGAYVTIDTGTTTDKGWPIEEYNSGGTDHLWVKFYDGTQTTADSYLTGTVSSAQRPYQSTRVGKGVAYAIVTARINQSLFSGFPTFGFVLDSVPLYNPASDTTVGGSGAHRWSDRSSWGGAGDELPMVQLYNVLRGISYDGQWLYGMQGLSAGRLPAARWISEIAKCSATVTGEDGNEPAYRSAGMIDVSTEVGSAVEALLIAASARLSEVGGIYKPLVGLPTATAASFSDDDIITTEPQMERPFPTLSETVNAITARYPEPTESYNLKDAPAIYNSDWEAEDGGRRLPKAITLANVPYAAQVQRLLSAAAAQARRFRTHSFVLSHNFWHLEPQDRVEWTSVRRGYSSKQFLIDTVMDLPNGDVMVEILEIDNADYSWTHGDDFVPVTRTPATVVRPTAVALPGFAVSAVSITDAGGNARRPGVLLEWTAADLEDANAIEWQVRVKATELALPPGSTLGVANGSAIIESGLVGAVEYQIRARASGTRQFDWSGWASVTTPDIRIGAADISDALAADIADAGLVKSVDTLPADDTDGPVVFLTTDQKLYRWTGSPAAWAATIATEDLIGQIVQSQITDAAITTSKIAALAITASKIAAGAIIADKIAANAVTADKIAAEAITTAKLTAGAVTIDKIASSLESDDFNAGVAGWRITKAGDAEFNSLTVREDMIADNSTIQPNGSGSSATVSNPNIWYSPSYTLSFPGKMVLVAASIKLTSTQNNHFVNDRLYLQKSGSDYRGPVVIGGQAPGEFQIFTFDVGGGTFRLRYETNLNLPSNFYWRSFQWELRMLAFKK